MAAETNWRIHWDLPADVTYLNHGSFGPSPRVVQQAREEWSRRLESEPMDFFVRRMEGHLDEAAARLGAFVGADPDDLIFVENATSGMNLVAANIELREGDEVLCTNHEYGAVLRIWRRVCEQAGASVVVRALPYPITSELELVDVFFGSVTERTRLIVVSHITSPTALILPAEVICRRAKELGIPVCIDGPHALAMLPVNIRRLGCDYYTASCHKWLSAPFGSGFLYVARRHQQGFGPLTVSWGGSVSGRPASWKDEFTWSGTRDPAASLAIPAAIDFLESCGVDEFRRRTNDLARYAREQITSLTGLVPFQPDDPAWYGSMITLPIPSKGVEPPKHPQRDPLQDVLWEQHRIEVPIVHWHGRRYIRVSCHLYNTREEIDRLVLALAGSVPV
jgi:isopenicillin-N epimerase